MRVYTPNPIDASVAPVIQLDFTACADAQDRVLRVVFSVYETTSAETGNTAIYLCYDAGGWANAAGSINNQESHPANVFNPSNGGALNTAQWDFEIPGESGVLFWLWINHNKKSGTYNYDFVVECLDAGEWRDLDGTGVVYSLNGDTFSVSPVSTDAVADGFLVVEGGDDPGPDPDPPAPRSITFGPLSSVSYPSSGKTRVGAPLHLGVGFELAEDAGYGFTALAALDTGGVGDAEDSYIDPPIPAHGASALTVLFSEGVGAETIDIAAEGFSSLGALRGTGYGLALEAGNTPAAGFTALGPVRSGGYADMFAGAYAVLVAVSPEVSGWAGLSFEDYESGIGMTDSVTPEIALVFEALIQLEDSLGWVNQLMMTLSDSITAQAVFTVLLETSFTDTVLVEDSLDALPRMLLAMADQLVMTGEVDTQMNALILLVGALALSDHLSVAQEISFESVIAAADSIEELFLALMTLVSEVDATDEVALTAGFTVLLSDALYAVDEIGTGMSAMIELFDTADFSVRLNLPGHDGGLYIGYAMNLRNAGVAVYDNYPFTSFDEVGGLALAVGEGGLYLLEGDDDAGEPIHARIRTGLTDFGSAVYKHSPNAYVGYTAEGSLLLKVITTDKGHKKANTYKLSPRASTAPTNDRFNVAKGLTSVYWGYQIENVDGVDFELDTVKVWPFIVQRRKKGR